MSLCQVWVKIIATGGKMGMLQRHRYEKSALLINGVWLDCTHRRQHPKLLMNQETWTKKNMHAACVEVSN